MTIEYTQDAEYAGQKLSGSIVRLNGRPIYIERVYSDGSVYATNFMGHEVNCQLNELDLEPVPLGYINLKRDAIYGQRMPSRYYIQGLRNNNFTSLGGAYGYAPSSFSSSVFHDYGGVS